MMAVAVAVSPAGAMKAACKYDDHNDEEDQSERHGIILSTVDGCGRDEDSGFAHSRERASLVRFGPASLYRRQEWRQRCCERRARRPENAVDLLATFLAVARRERQPRHAPHSRRLRTTFRSGSAPPRRPGQGS